MASYYGKTGDYLIGEGSHYFPNQLNYDPLSPLGIPFDLHRVLQALNMVEAFYGITKTVWSTTMGDPRQAEHPHYCVRIQGNRNNLGTLPEAIDQMRSDIGETVWNWEFGPTLEEFHTEFHSHKLCASSLAIAEMFLAIGVLKTPAGVGQISVRTIAITHVSKHYNAETGICSDTYSISDSGGWARIFGKFENQTQLVFSNKWETHGSVLKERSIFRSAQHWKLDDPDPTPDEYVYENYSAPGITCKVPGATGIDQLSGNTATLYINIYRQDNYTESAGHSELEAVESAFTDLWHWHDGPIDVDPDDEFHLSSVSSGDGAGEEFSHVWGLFQKLGPYGFLHRINIDDPFGDPITEVFKGDWQETQQKEGLMGPPPLDEFGGLDLTEAWRATYGFITPSLNNPLWAHNAADRASTPHIDFSEVGTPEAYHHQPMPMLGQHTYLEDYTSIGSGDWRSSNVDPFDGAGYPFDSTDPEDAIDREDAVRAILSRLSGNGAGVFDPATQTPKRYFWVWPEGFTQVPDLATTLRPADGVIQTLESVFKTHANTALPSKNSLGVYESFWKMSLRGAISCYGDIGATRKATVRFPLVDRTRSRHLVWDSPGTLNHSPLEDIVTRF